MIEASVSLTSLYYEHCQHKENDISNKIEEVKMAMCKSASRNEILYINRHDMKSSVACRVSR